MARMKELRFRAADDDDDIGVSAMVMVPIFFVVNGGGARGWRYRRRPGARLLITK